MMRPQIVEVAPEYKDFAEDSLKLSTVMIAAWLLNNYVLGTREGPIESVLRSALVFSSGLAVFYLVVDKLLLRFVVKSGKEGFYHVQKRYK